VTMGESVLQLEDIVDPVSDWIGLNNEKLKAIAAKEDASLLGTVLGFTLGAPGKRLRPALVFLTSGMFGHLSKETVDLAAATECLHSATLIHDDMVDESPSRRGQDAVHVAWSSAAAVLSGDYLFAVSADLVAGLERPRIVRMFADTIMHMSRSEFESPGYSGDGTTMTQQYMSKISSKTASLLALCCEAAANLSDRAEDEQRCMREYGTNLGLAFQIADDVLDVRGDIHLTGKPVGNDLRQGLLTLPTIHYLENSLSTNSVVHGVFDGTLRPSASDIDDAIVELEASGAVQESLETADKFAARARAFLQELPQSEYSDALEDLTNYVFNRIA